MDNIYPFDVAELSKGDFISPKKITQISGVGQTDPNYNLIVLKYKAVIEKQWPDYHEGESVWVKTEGNPPGIRILTDKEGVKYGDRRMNSCFKGIRKTTSTYTNMDTKKLDGEELDLRNKNIMYGTVVTGSLKSAINAEKRRQLTEPDKIEE